MTQEYLCAVDAFKNKAKCSGLLFQDQICILLHKLGLLATQRSGKTSTLGPHHYIVMGSDTTCYIQLVAWPPQYSCFSQMVRNKLLCTLS